MPTTSALDPALLELAGAYGVATSFVDWKGRDTEVSAETLTAVLKALDVEATTPEQAEIALRERRDSSWRRMLPPCVVCREGTTASFAVHVQAGEPVEVGVRLETGGERAARQIDNWEADREIDGTLTGEASFEVPAGLPIGYHTITARSGDRTAECTLIVTPGFLGFPASLGNRRTWGLATQLYSVRSRHSWGIGDLTDLTDLAVWSAARHRAGYVLVNPMHAAQPQAPLEPSPYLPVSRRFFNPIYLRLEAIPEFAVCDNSTRKGIRRRLNRLLRELEGVDAIERNRVWPAKQAALREIFAAGRSAGREIAFRAYCDREGTGLRDYATWCALTVALGDDWREWPEEYRDPGTDAVARFRDENAGEIDFQRWLQWCLDEQLRDAQAAATSAGMPVGIVHDLAVGVSPAGADAWSLGDAFALGVNVGAPPDQFTQLGQDWGQPPLRPDRLAELAYLPLRNMLATILRHSGGVRVDHIIGLFRLWWVPAGMTPKEGTYVRYDHDAMIGVLALEAHRAGALVVGEDLGTVEPWVRDYLRSRGLLGTSILWFEQDYTQPGGVPWPPERWREYCLASVTTHDLPPTAGYLAGDHVRLRHELGLLTEDLDSELERDRDEQRRWLDVLRERGLLAEGEESHEAVIQALHGFLLQTPSRMLNLALTDAVADRRTQNQPGTVDEYPNWRVPLAGPDGTPMLLEDVFTDEHAADLCDLMADGLED